MQAQPWKVNLTLNALAQTFCDQAYQNNPAFLAFLQRSGLPFQSESEFTPRGSGAPQPALCPLRPEDLEAGQAGSGACCRRGLLT